MDRPGSRHGRFVAGAAALLLVFPTAVHSHAFGSRYDLPLPLWLYLVAAGAAVLLSFVIMALTLKPGAQRASGVEGRPVVSAFPAPLLLAGRAASVSLLLIVVVAAFAGDDSPTRNFAAVFVWVVWWVGFVFVQALVIDLWSAFNPFEALARLTCRTGPSNQRDDRRKGPVTYPQGLGYWPAFAGFVAFAWLELVSDLGEQPETLGVLIVAYAVLTLAAAFAFGPDAWFGRGDPFAVVLRVFGRFAPLTIGEGRIRPRVPGRGLLTRAPLPLSMVALVAALLATVSFDGFVETPAWAAVLEWVSESERLRRPLLTLQGAGVDLLKLVKTAGLLLAIAVFLAVYVVFAALIDRVSGDRRGLGACAGSFVLTLMPIAIGYHLAHYLSYLLIAGQLAIALASDPFGLGWDLFGTASRAIDIAIVDARFVWFTAVFTIVAGHVIAVYLAHAMALRVYRDRRRAIRSQIPMLVLMVGYTMTSLWILSQPIVEV